LKRCFLLFSYLMEILCVEATKNLPILWLWRKRHTRTHILCGSCKDSLKKTTIKPLYVLFPFPKFPSSNGNKHGFFMTSHGNQNSKSMQPHSYQCYHFLHGCKSVTNIWEHI
jgi:hypothetical protein